MLDDFTWNDDYSVAFAPTDDPRLLAVIQRDTDPHTPDGDALAPAAWVGRYGRLREITSVYVDEHAPEVYARAVAYYGRGDARVERYMRAFYGVRQIEEVSSTVDQGGDSVVIFDTPDYRKHCGIPDEATDVLKGCVEEWQAYLNGDVYGVGYALNVGRIMDDGEPIDLTDWDVTIDVWGYYGERYAKEAAASFENGRPDLPDMLPLPTED